MRSNNKKLYGITFIDDVQKIKLYHNIKGQYKLQNNNLVISKKQKIDFLTFFNGFSLNKWLRYTTLKRLFLCTDIQGPSVLCVYSKEKNEKVILKIIVDGPSEIEIPLQNLENVILGIYIEPIETCIVKKLEYWGEFEQYDSVNICCTICTYKRENYVKKTISTLSEFLNKNRWFQVLVVDNGQTLQSIEEERLRIIPNPNYGGSGGFTRGMIECCNNSMCDYVLLMDDDIDLDTKAIEITHSFLSGLKKEYKDSFLAGSMLVMDNPTIQYEKAGYWKGVKGYSYGRNLDVSIKDNLYINEKICNDKLQFAAWWYCCIPIKRIREIGYPLPVFIKGDDIEYSIRNNREVITLNGIGVWHEAFTNKISPMINYYSDRNMLMINFFCDYGRLFFSTVLFLRILRRCMMFDKNQINVLIEALYDLHKGLYYITNDNPKVRNYYFKNIDEKSNIELVKELCSNFISVVLYFNKIKKEYLSFREIELSNSKYWERYMKY